MLEPVVRLVAENVEADLAVCGLQGSNNGIIAARQPGSPTAAGTIRDRRRVWVQPIDQGVEAMTSIHPSGAASRTTFWLALAAMSFIVILSNWAVLQFAPWIDTLLGQPANTFNYGQFTFPLTFLVTDIVNRLFGAPMARRIAGAAFLVAVPSSIIINGLLPFPGDPEPWISAIRVGLASGTAFIIGQLLDIAIFQRLRRMAWWLAPFAGSIIASVVDTTVFYSIAFYGQDWVVRAGTVDFIVKVVVAIIALVPFRLAIASALRRETSQA